MTRTPAGTGPAELAEFAVLATLAGARERTTELGQVIAVLSAAGHDPADLPVATGDRLLLALYRDLTGQDIEPVLTCGCGEFSTVRLGADTVPPPRPRTAVLGRGGGLRQPAYGDLLGLPPGESGAAELLRRCTVGHPERPPEPGDFEAVDDSLAGPLVFDCPACGAEVSYPVDVQTLVLRGLLTLLDELDHDVHVLASAYGWDLAAIDALPRDRRRRLAAFAVGGG
ncbi:hypothetical protein ACGFSB_32880 [Streptomyces sp. NPDC048441]|uniref:hypothetical protein n=1 Tax=Streptomyces sp. NPDC048441 TaxID=3365552 RepID=UPI0037201A45